jgi:hypothetical protein
MRPENPPPGIRTPVSYCAHKLNHSADVPVRRGYHLTGIAELWKKDDRIHPGCLPSRTTG